MLLLLSHIMSESLFLDDRSTRYKVDYESDHDYDFCFDDSLTSIPQFK